MKVIETDLPGVKIIEPRLFGEARGWFKETWNAERYAAAGIPASFIQDNSSFSVPGVLRGLHYQHPTAQGKLVFALSGEIYDVAVDIRPDSPTFRRWIGVALSGENHRQLWVPEGFAHGFLVLRPALVLYKVNAPYDPKSERGLAWNDEDLAIDWPRVPDAPGKDPILSDKDARAPRLRDLTRDALP